MPEKNYIEKIFDELVKNPAVKSVDFRSNHFMITGDFKSSLTAGDAALKAIEDAGYKGYRISNGAVLYISLETQKAAWPEDYKAAVEARDKANEEYSVATHSMSGKRSSIVAAARKKALAEWETTEEYQAYKKRIEAAKEQSVLYTKEANATCPPLLKSGLKLEVRD